MKAASRRDATLTYLSPARRGGDGLRRDATATGSLTGEKGESLVDQGYSPGRVQYGEGDCIPFALAGRNTGAAG